MGVRAEPSIDAMDPSVANPDGTDDSSIKPVSSLRARFENLNKPTDVARSSPPPPLRPISPAPKFAAPRDVTPVIQEPPPVPPARPKERPKIAAIQLPSAKEPAAQEAGGKSPTRGVLPAPTLEPKPPRPPSFMIQPPHSPPKGRSTNLAYGDHPAYLNPDGNATPSTPAASPRQFKIPSRPHTPSLEPRRSPRLAASQPPSPPPPRRSGELRRERERAPAKPAPPTVNRAEKPLIPSRHSFQPDPSLAVDVKRNLAAETSPFSSPPSSPDNAAEEEAPPMLPTRPRPQVEPTPRPNSLAVGFEPPPVHHAVARRREREGEGAGAGLPRTPVTPQVTGEIRPALPSRASVLMEPPPRPTIPAASTRPPPRPPRPNVGGTAPTEKPPISGPPKRVVSTPTTQLAPPPTRPQARSMTVDRTSDRTPAEFRQPPVVAVVPTVAPAQSPAPAGHVKLTETSALATAYPDTSSINRRPPYIKQGVHEIATKYDPRTFAVCGEYLAASGHFTRVWNVNDGELLMSLSHGEGIKATAVCVKPGADAQQEGTRLWIGNNFGDLMEADVTTTTNIVAQKQAAHGRHEIVRIYRHYDELWTLCDGGTLLIWGPDESGVPNLNNGPHQTFNLPKKHTFSLVVGSDLWHASGKEIRVFRPRISGQDQFQVLLRPLQQEGAGEVTSGTLIRTRPDSVFFGHIDGKISIYSAKDYSCLGLINLSSYKINTLAGVGRYIWAGYNTGRICVYDMNTSPWTVRKDWQAHEKDNPIIKLQADHASFYRLDRQQVISLGADNVLKTWDGLLQDDWLEGEMKSRDGEYCDFEDVKALVMTWNAGASTPHSLRYSDSDATFIRELLQSSGSPEILIFGFQELVDLEDKTATAKRLFKGKKKEGSDQERMSHQYRDWRDFLLKSLDDYMPRDDLYHLLHTAPLVGLFTCIFVKSTIRDRIRNLSSAEVKRGMGGLHGNKGAIVVRFLLDDTSLCFINCHLAAGQTQANHRHNDVAAILEAAILPVERDPSLRVDTYVGGGDGTMILDHELCVLNGDLNYRIDTMSRDTVVAAVKARNLAKIMERDQLLVARRRNPAFRLRAFEEAPITFAPTYKYDVGTDNYDTSEKRRSPAWCDRILYRAARARIRQLDYRRHEVRVSDHRPVSARFVFTIKRIDARRRAGTWADCWGAFEDVKQKEGEDERLYYLTDVCGYEESACRRLLKERSARRLARSPSRRRE